MNFLRDVIKGIILYFFNILIYLKVLFFILINNLFSKKIIFNFELHSFSLSDGNF